MEEVDNGTEPSEFPESREINPIASFLATFIPSQQRSNGPPPPTRSTPCSSRGPPPSPTNNTTTSSTRSQRPNLPEGRVIDLAELMALINCGNPDCPTHGNST